MQLYALDENGKIVSADRAYKQRNYRCLECSSCVRLRGGHHRKRHFYHLEPNRSCRLHQKGIIHLNLQKHLFLHLPKGDCELEYSMPAIGRIADVVWFSKKIVFEIQYSSITAQEVFQRNLDYQNLGWRVVWILHDRRYNQIRLSAAEQLLRFLPHYFTNMNAQGEGIIYDQFDLIHQGLRYDKMTPLRIDLTQPRVCISEKKSSSFLEQVRKRAEKSSYFFVGDLSDLDQDGNASAYLQEALEKESAFNRYQKLLKREWQKGKLVKILGAIFIRPYRFVFRILLERACR